MGKPTLIGFWASAASGTASAAASSRVRTRSSMESLLRVGRVAVRCGAQKAGRPGTCTRIRYTDVDAVM